MTLTSKQRAYLRSLAVTQEPILHVGKGGISDTLVKQVLLDMVLLVLY